LILTLVISSARVASGIFDESLCETKKSGGREWYINQWCKGRAFHDPFIILATSPFIPSSSDQQVSLVDN
jgi:hypothetical protein